MFFRAGRRRRALRSTHLDDGKLGAVHRPVERRAAVAARRVDVDARPAEQETQKSSQLTRARFYVRGAQSRT